MFADIRFFYAKIREKSVKIRKKYVKSNVFTYFLYPYYIIKSQVCQVLFENKIREQMFFYIIIRAKSLSCF